MAEQFNIDAKLVIAGVQVKGDLNAGKLKFDIDTSALKKLATDATDAAVKAKRAIAGLKVDNFKIKLDPPSLRKFQDQIRAAVSGVLNPKIKPTIMRGKAGDVAGIAQRARAIQATQQRTPAGAAGGKGGQLLAPIGSLTRVMSDLAAALRRSGAALQAKPSGKPLTAKQAEAAQKRIDQPFSKEANQIKADLRASGSAKKKVDAAELSARTKRLAALKAFFEKQNQVEANISSRRAKGGKGARGGGGGLGPPTSPTGAGGLSDFGGGGGGRRGPGAAPGGAGRGAGAVNQLKSALDQVTTSTDKASKSMDSLEELSFQVGKKAAAFRGVAIAINTIVSSAQAAVKFVIDLNDSLLEVNKILQFSASSLQILGNELVGLSADTGVAVDQTVKIAEAFARAGLSGRGYGSIVDLTGRALVGMQGTTLDAAQATELFIQILQQVEGGVRGLNKELITTTKLFDVLGKAEDITASKATDVQAAFKRSAASIFATGVSIEQATSLISILQERTQRGGDVIGTALKTMAARISSSSSEATKALNAIGDQTIDTQGNLRNLFDVLQDVSIAFKGLTESEQANVAVKAAGIRQVEIFRSAVRDFGRVQDVNTQLVNANGDALRKQAVEQQKLTNIIQKAQIALQQLVKTASEGILGDIFVFAVKALSGLLQNLQSLDKTMGGVVSAFAAFAVIGVGLKVLIPMFIGIKRAVGFFIGSQREAASAMGKIQTGADAVAQTVNTRMNTALQQTVALTQQAATNMGLMAGAGSQGGGFFGAQGTKGPGNRDAGGGLIVAPGATALPSADNAQRREIQRQRLAKEITSRRKGLLSKTVGIGGNLIVDSAKKAGRGLKSLAGNIIGLSIVGNLAGGALLSLADSLRKSGNEAGATAAGIAGGGISGAATGAFVGSLFGPIGTAIGAAIGGITGALPELIKAFGGAEDSTSSLGKEMMRLGIIQRENGKITSEMAEKIQKGLKDINTVGRASSGIEEADKLQKKGGKEAAQAANKLDKVRAQADKDLAATFDRTASLPEQFEVLLKRLSVGLRERTGEEKFDLGAEILKVQAGAGQVSESLSAAIIDEVASVAKGVGASAKEIRALVNELQVQSGRALEAGLNETNIKVFQGITDRSFKTLQLKLIELFPKGAQNQTTQAPQIIQDAKQAILDIANSAAKADDERIRTALAFAKKEGFKTEAGDLLQGPVAVRDLERRVEEAEDIGKRRRKEETTTGAPQLIQKLLELLSGTTGRQDQKRDLQAIERSKQQSTEAFKNLTDIDLGPIVGDEQINKFEGVLRKFVEDFSTEVIKLNEVRLRAITPQLQLADAIAKNSVAALAAAQLEAKFRKTTAKNVALEELSKLVGGQRTFASPEDVASNAGFEDLKGIDFAENIRNLKKTDITNFKQLINEGNLADIGKVFEVDEKRAAIILEKSKKRNTVVINQFFNNLLSALNDAARDNISSPIEISKILQGVESATPNLNKLDAKEKKTILDAAEKASKTGIQADVAVAQKAITSNKDLVAAIKVRLGEEARLLEVERQSRQAKAASASVALEELTGIRRITAAREIERKLLEGNIDAQERRIAGIQEEINKENARPEIERAAGGEDRLRSLRQLSAKEQLKLENFITQNRLGGARAVVKASQEALNTSRKAADAERKRINTVAAVINILAVGQTPIQKFNVELAALAANFKVSRKEFADEAKEIAKLTKEGERESRGDDLRKKITSQTLDLVKAEAQLLAKRRDAVKQITKDLLGNQQEQVDKQREIIEATKQLGQAFEEYLQAIDGVILATTNYNLGLQLAEVQARKTTGGFTGIRQELEVVQETFRAAESMARRMGASEKTLVDIRRQSINQQLALFNELLSQQTSAAQAFFTSSAEDQADLFRGIQAAKGIADLLGGSFEAFKGKVAGGELNELGKTILSLPQEMRQDIVDAIDTLRATGVGIEGFTADELMTAINSAAFGESAALQIDPLFEVQQRIADLQREQAQIATEQLIAANEGVQEAKKQVEAAEAVKDAAEIQLERTKEEGVKLREKLSGLQGALKTTLLQSIQVSKDGSNSIVAAVTNSVDKLIASLPGSFSKTGQQTLGDAINTSGSQPTSQTETRKAANSRRNAGKNQSVNAGAAAGAGPADAQVLPATQGGDGGLLSPEILTIIKENGEKVAAAQKESDEKAERSAAKQQATLDAIEESSKSTSAALQSIDTKQDNVTTIAQPDINVNIEGTSTVTVTGFEAGVTRITAGLTEVLGDLVTTAQATEIANAVVENIRVALKRINIITETTQ